MFSISPSATPLKTNPVFFQGDSTGRFNYSYQNIAPGLSGTFINMNASLGVYLPKTNGYLGFYGERRVKGLDEETFQNLSVAYAQNFKLSSDINLRLGGQVGVNVRKFEPYFPYYPHEYQTFYGYDGPIKRSESDDFLMGEQATTLDVSLGGAMLWKDFVLGLSVFHVNRSHIPLINGEPPLDARVVAQASYHFGIGRQFGFDPLILFSNQFSRNTFGLGGIFSFYRAQIGATYETEYAEHNVFFGYNFERLGIYYGYQNIHFEQIDTKIGGHELSVSYCFWKRPAHKNFVQVSGVYF